MAPPEEDPPVCPPEEWEYSLRSRHGRAMVLTGFVPMLGGFLQGFEWFVGKPPATYAAQNKQLQEKIERTLANWEQSGVRAGKTWKAINDIVEQSSALTVATAKAKALPLTNRIMYLKAFLLSLCFLAASLVTAL